MRKALPAPFSKTTAILSIFLAMACVEAEAQPDAVVASDGSGNFTSVEAAIVAAPQDRSASSPWTILIKPGTYKERIYVQREKRFVRIVGEDPKTTILTCDLTAKSRGPDGKEIGTFRSASTTIDADDFVAENLTFENSQGAGVRALAVSVTGDRGTFRNCIFLGGIDTLFVDRGRHYFEDCTITGHFDFIFGGGTAWFEKCQIVCLKDGYITAASTPDNQAFGFVFSHCKITGETPELKTFLGRPWRGFASTFFLHTEMSEVVKPGGWDNWKKPENEKTVRYAEYGSTGPGGDSSARKAWSSQLSEAEAKEITKERVLGGEDHWTPPPKIDLSASPAPTLAPAIPQGATFKSDVEYRRVLGEKLLLDVCVPEGEGPFPVAIMVHGGGWIGGDKQRDHVPVLDALTAAKFTWFSINYRLAPTHRWPECLEDTQAAIRWVKAHAAEYKGDPHRVALLGYSAGGHLASLAAVLADETTTVQAVVGFAPPTDMVADNERRGGLSAPMQMLLNRPKPIDEASRVLLREISPINHLKRGLPPFLLMHGTDDKSVPYEQSIAFQAKLTEAEVPCELVSIKGAGHRLVDWSNFDDSYLDKMAAWLKVKLTDKHR